jgi:fluoroquinolone transport system permease protein
MTALSTFAPRLFWRLMASDAMNVARDPMLILAAAMSLAPAAVFLFFRESIDAAAFDEFGISDVMRYASASALVLPAVLIGWVTGFLLLEDRDEGTLSAIDVTPVGKTGFLGYRVAVTVVIVVAIVLASVPAVAPEAGAAIGTLLAALIACEAAIVAVLLPALARNKVEGLALTKVMNLAILFPLAAIIASPWRYLAGIVPSYWIGELLAVSRATYLVTPVAVGIAVAVHAVAVTAAFRFFRRSRV